MKNHTKKVLLLTLLSIWILGCSKDDGNELPPPTTGVEELPGIDLEEFETDLGAIGISINARDIARKGYRPTTADITVTATTGDYSQKILFDEFNNLATLSLKNEDLSEEAQAELKDGVPVSVRVLDKNENELATKSITKLSFTPSPSEEHIPADKLEDLYAKVNLREDVRHYVQIVNQDSNEIYGAPNSIFFPNTVLLNTPIIASKLADLDYNSENTETFTTYRFAEVPGEEGVFTIAVHNGDDIHYLYIVPANSELRIQSKANLIRNGGNNTGAPPNYKFKIEKVEAGLYTITPTFTGNPLFLINDRLNAGNTNSQPAYFRILSFDIDWDIQPIESKFMHPILPPSATSEAYNSTLRNCSSGTLQQTIGRSESLETKEVLGWEESMSVSTTQEYSVSVTIEAEVSTKFFGAGGSVRSSVTGSYSFSKSRTNTSTRSGSFEETRTTEISTERTQEVPPGTAITVADVYQTYENVRIPYVQRFRIKGNYQEDSKALSGEEITTQFAFNSFTGVITDVQSDYIEVTVRGTNLINRLIETETISKDIEGACDN
ncbi:ETX/MTX2 family pore-forming toxin [Aquimarina spongiae]|uniref:Toxin ETX/toxin MTX2 n=1 Tax=Aquimarina spongiae TaxID=570521 RepID=A0A1M6K4H1_9FLAO|nr:ETX/MTX2 family pore-forming toxin [Aquimarina spongiae]SHJ53894.1 toxin ETX/toxin MTX2 [Aquimarina spongiae]